MTRTDLAHPTPVAPAFTARALTMALAAWSWVPIRSLAPRHRHRIEAHLLSLEPYDRYLRFGYPATDEQIVRYVASIDFGRDELFGIFNRRLALIAMAHLAYSPDATRKCERASAEFGVSVNGRVRGRGYGTRLFEHAVLHARNRGVDTLSIHALTENLPMLKIARRAGATVERAGCESEACLKLPPENLLTRFGELMEAQAAEFDYRLKEQAHRFNGLMESLAEVKSRLNRATPTALE